METSILYQIHMGFILQNETTAILASVKPIAFGKPCLELPNIVPISLQDRINIGH